MARVVPNAKSIYSGLGKYPRATMRQAKGLPSVDTIQTNQAYDPSPINPLP
jgi:hypothetical protein